MTHKNQHKPFIFRNYRVHLWEKSRVKTASCLTATLDFPSAFAQKTVKNGLNDNNVNSTTVQLQDILQQTSS